jgi:hypothetical protein
LTASGGTSYLWDDASTNPIRNITAGGTYTVEVTDGNGCTDTEMATVTVTSCGYSISGKIIWEHDGSSGVKDVTVALSGDETGSTTTPVGGNYTLTPTSGSNFTVTPGKSINKLNGVTVADAVAIQQHVVNTTPITSPYKQVGADVNKSNSISTIDATILNQALLGNPAALAQFKTSWRFVPATYTMPLPPWGFPEKISYTGLSSDQIDQDYFGIKTGDVVSTYANPANLGGNPMLTLRLKDQMLEAGEELKLLVRADQWDKIAAFQLALRFDPSRLKFLDIQPAANSPLPLTADHFGKFQVAEGALRAVWSQAEELALPDGAPVFQLRFRILESGGQLQEALWLDEEALPALAYSSALVESGIALRFDATTAVESPDQENGFHLLQNRPNPFAKSTLIGFHLPEAGAAQLRIYDVSGRLIREINKNYPAGYSEEDLLLDGAVGVLMYELVTPFGTLTRRMVRVGQ